MLTRRDFIRTSSSAAFVAATCGISGCAGTRNPAYDSPVNILIVGGGAAGITMAARLRWALPKAAIAVADSAERHLYQPGLAFVGTGVWQPGDIWKREDEVIPAGVRWIRSSVAAIDAPHNTATFTNGDKLRYDFLVLAPEIQLNWNEIQGVSQATLGQGNAHSVYDFDGAVRTWQAVQKFTRTGGRGIFTDTWTEYKCHGAPIGICLLAEHFSRKLGTRSRLSFTYATAARQLCDVQRFAPRLEALYKERDVPIRVNSKLVGIDVSNKRATFENCETGKSFTEDYDFLHFTPPQSAPDFIRKSDLGWTEGEFSAGCWVKVDQKTLVHKDYPNIVAIGDAAGLPTAKSIAAITKQSTVAVTNLCSIIAGQTPTAKYDGYTAYPIVTDFGHAIMAEFKYAKRVTSSFPFNMLDTSMELRSAWWLAKYALKPYYFHAMLRGW